MSRVGSSSGDRPASETGELDSLTVVLVPQAFIESDVKICI